jgi:hypothetical protein
LANDKKFRVKNGITTPSVDFADGNGSISATYLDVSNTLSFSGNSGQLFSITDTMSGVIFSVNDISGIPSIEVDDDGDIRLAESFGNVSIGTANTVPGYKLNVTGNAIFSSAVSINRLIANGSVGTSGYVLASNGSGIYWVDPAGASSGAAVIVDVVPPLAPSSGDLWWDSSSGQLKVYYNDGSSAQWVDASSSAIGYTGSASTAAGFAGSRGFDGSIGYVGSASTVIGYTGSVGQIGSVGYVGSGVIGSTGYTGSIGFVGSASTVIGYTGSVGALGYIGSLGYAGSAGSIGFTGSSGFDGSVGYTGSVGQIGSAGYVGSVGFTGSSGFDGSVGYMGSAGYAGSIGFV